MQNFNTKVFLYIIPILLFCIIRENYWIDKIDETERKSKLNLSVELSTDIQIDNRERIEYEKMIQEDFIEPEGDNSDKNIAVEDVLEAGDEIKARFDQRLKILNRACTVLPQLRGANDLASHNQLIRIHRLVQDLAVNISMLNQNLEPFYKKKTILNPTQYPIIDGAGDPYDILYCTPPKCGTTSWKMGVQVLKDRRKGMGKKPESYIPRNLFYQKHVKPSQFSSDGNFNPLHGNITDWLKVLAVRNPWDRLYSAWKDKSRTFRFPNGTVNWDKAFRETTWAWGAENKSEYVIRELLEIGLNGHDIKFNASRFGIDQFETGPVPYTRRFTWEAMTRYVAQSTVGDELNQEHHWRTHFYHCGICSVDYNLITQLEHSKEETNWILEMKKWKEITHFGRQYTHERSAEEEQIVGKIWSSLSKNTLKGIYRHFWLDFVLLGYDVSKATDIINLGHD